MNKINSTEFPQEFYLPLDDKYREGRIVLGQTHEDYFIEIDIVQKESRKIYYHVGVFYHFDDPQDALDQGVQKLAHFLNSLN